MIGMTLKNIAMACKGELFCNPDEENIKVTGVQLDSRKIEKGNLFIATKGERVDGHTFIPAVIEKGAVCSICQAAPEVGPYILVKDSFQALKDIAAYYRTHLNIPIVGITGSVGKTSTKEAIAQVLSVKYNVLKTAGNFNNEVGLPLTILSIKEEHQVAVVEMGISDFGEMERLSSIAQPDICVITNIGLCHLENLKTQDGILKAKTEIFNHRNPNGAIILNGDDPYLNKVEVVDGTIPVRFGFGDNSKLKIESSNLKGLLGSEFVLKDGERELQCSCSLPGPHVITNSACAACVGFELGLTEEEIIKGISEQRPVSGRSNLIETGDYLVIDDCYNANPVSMREAIDLLKLSNSRKVAILGDMFELGENEESLHAQVGEYAAEGGIDVILFVGGLSKKGYLRAKGIASGNQQIQYFSQRDELLEALFGIIKKGDSVLVKASHGMQFDIIVKALCES